MKITTAPLPRPIALPRVGAVKLARVPAPKTPKIAALHISPVKNGLKVTHQFHQAPAKQFVFQNPALMVQHLKRIEKTAWLKPGQNPARRTDTVLDLGMTPNPPANI